MAWALQFDGVNDYVDTVGFSSQPTTFDLECDFETDSMSRQAIVHGEGGGHIEWQRVSGQITAFANFGSWVGLSASGYTAPGRHKVRLVYDGATFALYVDDVLKDSVSRTGAVGFYYQYVIGKHASSANYHFSGKIFNTKIATNYLSVNLDPNTSNHGTGQPVLTDTIGGNNAQGVNFIENGDAWVNSGGESPIEIDVPLVSSNPTVFAPDSVLTEVLIEPDVVQGTASVSTPDSVSRDGAIEVPVVQGASSVHDPEVVTDKLIEVQDTVDTVPVVQNPEVLAGGIVEVTSPVTGDSTVYVLEIAQPITVQVDSMIDESMIQILEPFILSGDGIVVPSDRKKTMNDVCAFLREMGFKGSNNDVLRDWLFTEGMEEGALNDKMMEYLKSQGLDGTLTDMKAQWKKL